MSNLYLINGKIYTQDARVPHASAIALRGNRIWAVGSDAEIRSLAEPEARIIDLGGRRVLPGLNDGHFHYFDWSLALRQLPLSTLPSLSSVREKVIQAAQKPGNDWILGRGLE